MVWQEDDQGGGYFPISVTEEISNDGSSVWTAVHTTLPGCNAVGKTLDEAVENLAKSREAWLATANEHHIPVPEKSAEQTVAIVYAIREGSAPSQSDAGADELLFHVKPAA